jgi:tryptophan 2,3-dioxygenase
VAIVNDEKADANWWSFSIDESERGERIRDDGTAGTREVNPAVAGRRLLSYHLYLGLDRLLACQVPSSRAPDERIFIVSHQLFELVFKQMIFDLRVIAETFSSLLELESGEFSDLVGIDGAHQTDTATAEFWRPAATAAGRMKHGARNVIPVLMAYLASEDTFDNGEFAVRFRDNLVPASGFQSAQFRLIQRALGKSLLLDVRLFPADMFLQAYEGKGDEELSHLFLDSENAGLVSVVDPLIIREGAAIATPPAGSPLAPVAELDDLAHRVLARVASLVETGGPCEEEISLPMLTSDEEPETGMERKFRQRLRVAVEKKKMANDQPAALSGDEEAMIEKRGEVFGKDWARAVAAENSRRELIRPAGRGALFLLRKGERGHLASILGCLGDADSALSEKFLLFHQRVVEKRLGSVAGTAGGGAPYLDFSRELIGLFPALVGFRELRQHHHSEG